MCWSLVLLHVSTHQYPGNQFQLVHLHTLVALDYNFYRRIHTLTRYNVLSNSIVPCLCCYRNETANKIKFQLNILLLLQLMSLHYYNPPLSRYIIISHISILIDALPRNILIFSYDFTELTFSNQLHREMNCTQQINFD